jgi:hypothetical protein
VDRENARATNKRKNYKEEFYSAAYHDIPQSTWKV